VQQSSLTGSVLYLLVPLPLPSQLPPPVHCLCCCLCQCLCLCLLPFSMVPAASKFCQYPLPLACCLCWSPVPVAQLAGSWQGLLQFSRLCNCKHDTDTLGASACCNNIQAQTSPFCVLCTWHVHTYTSQCQELLSAASVALLYQ